MKVNKKELEMFTDAGIKMLAKRLLNGQDLDMLYYCNLVDFNRVIDEMSNRLDTIFRPKRKHVDNFKDVLNTLGLIRFAEYEFHVYFGADYNMYDEYLAICHMVARNYMKLEENEFITKALDFAEERKISVELDFLEEIYKLYAWFLRSRFLYM